MQQQRFLRASAIVIVAATLGGGNATVYAQQQDLSKVEVRSQQIAPNLYVLFGAGGNIAVLTGDDGTVVVDDQLAGMAPKIRAAIALLTDKPVRFVINTHWHWDHTGTNADFGRGGSIIIAQENTRRRLSTPQFADLFRTQTAAQPAVALPIVTFSESVDLHLDGEDIAVIHLPNAHTDSDVALYFKSANAVHTGDVFTLSGYPFIDTASGGSIDGMIAANEQILSRISEDTIVIPGHGPIARRSDIQARLQMLISVRERIAAMLKRGRTLQQVMDAKPTRDFDGQYYKSNVITPDVWVQRVYVDLARSIGAAARKHR